MDIPALARVHKYEKKDGYAPGCKWPLRVSEAALFSHGCHDFLAYQTPRKGVLMCCVDSGRAAMFIAADSIQDGLKLWYDENSKREGVGL